MWTHELMGKPRADSTAGLASLWDGTSATLLRGATYATARFGVYGEAKAFLQAREDERRGHTGPLPLSQLVGCGVFAGAIAGLIGVPSGKPSESPNRRFRGADRIGTQRLCWYECARMRSSPQISSCTTKTRSMGFSRSRGRRGLGSCTAGLAR